MNAWKRLLVSLWEPWWFIYQTGNKTQGTFCFILHLFSLSKWNSIKCAPVNALNYRPVSTQSALPLSLHRCSLHAPEGNAGLRLFAEVWIVESVRSTADASTIRQFKASSVTEGSGMIKQLLTANSAVPFHPGQGSHLRAEHNRALCSCQSSLWLSSAGCILSSQRTQRECALKHKSELCGSFLLFLLLWKKNESLYFKTLSVFTHKYYICSWACANFKVNISFYCF